MKARPGLSSAEVGSTGWDPNNPLPNSAISSPAHSGSELSSERIQQHRMSSGIVVAHHQAQEFEAKTIAGAVANDARDPHAPDVRNSTSITSPGRKGYTTIDFHARAADARSPFRGLRSANRLFPPRSVRAGEHEISANAGY